MRYSLTIPLLAFSAILLSCPGSGQTACGDGFLEPGETCDDGNWLSGDGCDDQCQLECGNGVIDDGEDCEDGNRDPDDGCDERCRNECGNGVLDGGEECEPTLTPSDCGSDCRWQPIEPDIDLPEPGSSLTYAGELTEGSPTWTRPLGTCEVFSSINGECAWEGFVLVNDHGRAVTLTVGARASGTGDGTLRDAMIFLYEGAWPPHDPLSCLASNDDGGEGRDPLIEDIALDQDGVYYLVVSSFYGTHVDDHLGTFVLDFSVR